MHRYYKRKLKQASVNQIRVHRNDQQAHIKGYGIHYGRNIGTTIIDIAKYGQ